MLSRSKNKWTPAALILLETTSLHSVFTGNCIYFRRIRSKVNSMLIKLSQEKVYPIKEDNLYLNSIFQSVTDEKMNTTN